MNINTELAKKWVAALRSGKYQQSQGKLRREKPESFCCLGVLCEIAEITRGEFGYVFAGESGYSSNHAPSETWWQKQFGDTHLWMSTLWIMNDEGNKSFSEIADYIETTLDLTA